MYQDHPYGHEASGTKETVSAFTPAAVRDFYKQYYVAKNATVVVWIIVPAIFVAQSLYRFFVIQ